MAAGTSLALCSAFYRWRLDTRNAQFRQQLQGVLAAASSDEEDMQKLGQHAEEQAAELECLRARLSAAEAQEQAAAAAAADAELRQQADVTAAVQMQLAQQARLLAGRDEESQRLQARLQDALDSAAEHQAGSQQLAQELGAEQMRCRALQGSMERTARQLAAAEAAAADASMRAELAEARAANWQRQLEAAQIQRSQLLHELQVLRLTQCMPLQLGSSVGAEPPRPLLPAQPQAAMQPPALPLQPPPQTVAAPLAPQPSQQKQQPEQEQPPPHTQQIVLLEENRHLRQQLHAAQAKLCRFGDSLKRAQDQLITTDTATTTAMHGCEGSEPVLEADASGTTTTTATSSDPETCGSGDGSAAAAWDWGTEQSLQALGASHTQGAFVDEGYQQEQQHRLEVEALHERIANLEAALVAAEHQVLQQQQQQDPGGLDQLQQRVADLEAALSTEKERQAVSAAVAREAMTRMLADREAAEQAAQHTQQALQARAEQLAAALKEREHAAANELAAVRKAHSDQLATARQAAAEQLAAAQAATAEELAAVQAAAEAEAAQLRVAAEEVEAASRAVVARLEAKLARRNATASESASQLEAQCIAAVRAARNLQQQLEAQRELWACVRANYVRRVSAWLQRWEHTCLLLRCWGAWRSGTLRARLDAGSAVLAAAVAANAAAAAAGASAARVSPQQAQRQPGMLLHSPLRAPVLPDEQEPRRQVPVASGQNRGSRVTASVTATTTTTTAPPAASARSASLQGLKGAAAPGHSASSPQHHTKRKRVLDGAAGRSLAASHTAAEATTTTVAGSRSEPSSDWTTVSAEATAAAAPGAGTLRANGRSAAPLSATGRRLSQLAQHQAAAPGTDTAAAGPGSAMAAQPSSRYVTAGSEAAPASELASSSYAPVAGSSSAGLVAEAGRSGGVLPPRPTSKDQQQGGSQPGLAAAAAAAVVARSRSSTSASEEAPAVLRVSLPGARSSTARAPPALPVPPLQLGRLPGSSRSSSTGVAPPSAQRSEQQRRQAPAPAQADVEPSRHAGTKKSSKHRMLTGDKSPLPWMPSSRHVSVLQAFGLAPTGGPTEQRQPRRLHNSGGSAAASASAAAAASGAGLDEPSQGHGSQAMPAQPNPDTTDEQGAAAAVTGCGWSGGQEGVVGSLQQQQPGQAQLPGYRGWPSISSFGGSEIEEPEVARQMPPCIYDQQQQQQQRQHNEQHMPAGPWQVQEQQPPCELANSTGVGTRASSIEGIETDTSQPSEHNSHWLPVAGSRLPEQASSIATEQQWQRQQQQQPPPQLAVRRVRRDTPVFVRGPAPPPLRLPARGTAAAAADGAIGRGTSTEDGSWRVLEPPAASGSTEWESES